MNYVKIVKDVMNKINISNHCQKPENKEKHRNYSSKMRHTEEGYLKALYSRMMNRLKGGITFEELKTLYYSTDKCYYCGKEVKPFTVDKQIEHKIPISKGGTNNIKNLVISCKACNSAKKDKTEAEYLAEVV